MQIYYFFSGFEGSHCNGRGDDIGGRWSGCAICIRFRVVWINCGTVVDEGHEYRQGAERVDERLAAQHRRVYGLERPLFRFSGRLRR